MNRRNNFLSFSYRQSSYALSCKVCFHIVCLLEKLSSPKVDQNCVLPCAVQDMLVDKVCRNPFYYALQYSTVVSMLDCETGYPSSIPGLAVFSNQENFNISKENSKVYQRHPFHRF